MSDQIQGRDVTVKLFQNSRNIKNFPVTKFGWEAKQKINERKLVGKKRPTKKLIINGYKGTVDFDVEDGAHHEITALLNSADMAGIKAPRFAIQVKEKYAGGDEKKYRFTNVTFEVPKQDVNKPDEDVTGSFNWEAEDIVYQ